MLEQWVIDQLNPLKGEKLIILADPQRMIRAGAQAVDGWAKENGFTVLFCSGNLALREMYENLRNDPAAKIILVDRTRENARLPLFYPDLESRCKSRARLTITLRDFLVEKTEDERWERKGPLGLAVLHLGEKTGRFTPDKRQSSFDHRKLDGIQNNADVVVELRRPQ